MTFIRSPLGRRVMKRAESAVPAPPSRRRKRSTPSIVHWERLELRLPVSSALTAWPLLDAMVEHECSTVHSAEVARRDGSPVTGPEPGGTTSEDEGLPDRSEHQAATWEPRHVEPTQQVADAAVAIASSLPSGQWTRAARGGLPEVNHGVALQPGRDAMQIGAQWRSTLGSAAPLPARVLNAASGAGYSWTSAAVPYPSAATVAAPYPALSRMIGGDQPWFAEGGTADMPRSFQTGDNDAEGQLSFSEASPLDGWLRAVFNDGVWTSGWDFNFLRDAAIETYDQTWQPNEPRFGESMGVQPYEPTSYAALMSGIADFMGSGWDLSGTTPILCVYMQFAMQLRWYSGPNFNLLRQQNLGQFLDLLNGAVPGKHYRPVTGIIHEGLHVMMTSRWDVAFQRVDGVAFFYTQNLGRTWTEVPNVNPESVPGISGHPSSLGIDRGARWAFANAFPNGSHDSQTDAWFPWGDYLNKNGSPRGGQVGVFRATRPAVGTLWTVQPNRVIWDRWEPLDSGGLHAHGATVHAPQGVILSWWGDVGYRNEIVAHQFADLDNYATSEILTHRNAFGGYDPMGERYWYSNQSAGFAPGPEYGTALATADVSPERLVVASVSADGTQVRLEPLYASATNETAGASYSNRLSLWIHHLRGRGYVIREMGSVRTGNDNRMWASEDGRTWTKLQAKLGGTPVILGDQIVLNTLTGPYLYARPWLSVQPIRPLLLSPGGWNRHDTVLAQRTAPAPGNSVREVYRDELGVYRYYGDDVVLDYQPLHNPPVSPQTPLVEIALDQSTSAGTRWLMPPGETDDFSLRHYWQGWVYPLEARGLRPLYRIGGPGSNNLTPARGSENMANGQWMPTYQFGQSNNSTQLRGMITLGQMHTGSNRWLLASQTLTAGSHPTYPLAPGQQGSHEVAWLDGFHARRQWSAVLSFSLPSVGFDAWGSNGAVTMPIATVWANESTYIQLEYDQPARALSAQFFANGLHTGSLVLSDIWLSKEDRVDVMLTSDGGLTAMTAVIPQNNANPFWQSSVTSAVIGAPRQIRLSNHDQSEVVPLQWYAAHLHPNRFHTLMERLDVLRSPDLWLPS